MFIEIKERMRRCQSGRRRRRHGKVLILHIPSAVVSGRVSASTCVGERPSTLIIHICIHKEMAVIIAHTDEDHQRMEK
ncbi:hypothetical protein QQF64_009360 [Cirrhinus molitorella]|uniref:Uncharacterized protein n=1 Tax=Cirrhinus molitorella TaxID=172907 RepID=A0ABR3M521_9TELE